MAPSADPVMRGYQRLRENARRRHVPFMLTVADFRQLDEQHSCPICQHLFGTTGETRATTDRRDNARGYDAENVWRICWRCNRQKQDSTPAELERLARVTRGHAQDRLVGRWCHSFRLCDACQQPAVQCQGLVVARVDAQYYLVRFYNWVDGGPTGEELVAADTMTNWRFYETAEAWRAAYEDRLFWQHMRCHQRLA
jgi:hypothetical protein